MMKRAMLVLALALALLPLAVHAATLGVPKRAAVVDPQGFAAAKVLLARMRAATAQPTLGGGPGGPAARLPNAATIGNLAGNLLASATAVETGLLRKTAEGRAAAAAAGEPFRGVSVSSSESKLATGMASLLTTAGVGDVLNRMNQYQEYRVPAEFDAPEGRAKLCKDALAMGLSPETRACVCNAGIPWATCSAALYQEGLKMQEEQLQDPVVIPDIPLASASQLAELEQAGRKLAAKKTKCNFKELLGIFQGKCSGFKCNFPLPPPVGSVCTLKMDLQVCVPTVEFVNNALRLCPSAASVVDTCPVYAGPTYVAALAATKFAEDTYASISLQLCLKLKGFKKIVKWLGLDGICGGPTGSWWPVKEQVQVTQGISALVARLDFSGKIQYGNGAENDLCNFFKNARQQDAWNWHMKCADFCQWGKGSGKTDLTFALNLFFWSDAWTWNIVTSKIGACDAPPETCIPGQYTKVDEGGTRVCTTCPPGTWSSATKTFSCNKCPAGTANPSAGSVLASACKPCQRGQYAPKEGSTSCRPCRAASFNPYEGATDCISCPPGTFGSNVTGAASKASGCLNAPPGFYTSLHGRMKPTRCSLGSVQPLEGQTSCTQCATGEYTLDNLICTACTPGTRWRGYWSACETCPAGTRSAQDLRSCPQCGVGTFSRAGSPACTDCPRDSVASQPGAGACAPCTGATPYSWNVPEFYMNVYRRAGVVEKPRQYCHAQACPVYIPRNSGPLSRRDPMRSEVRSGRRYCCLVASHCPWTFTVNAQAERARCLATCFDQGAV